MPTIYDLQAAAEMYNEGLGSEALDAIVDSSAWSVRLADHGLIFQTKNGRAAVVFEKGSCRVITS